MGRGFLAFAAGNANNAVLAAAGPNFGLILNWLKWLLPTLPGAALRSVPSASIRKIAVAA